MAKETIEQIIEKTRQNFENKNIVAFLGIVESGKTVVASLLYYHLMSKWIPESNGKWEAVASSGDEAFNKIIRKMKQGEFTAATRKQDFPKLVVDIFSMEGNPSKIKLELHDMSGEQYTDLFTKEMDIGNRLRELLTKNVAYLAYAKQYVIIIDCEKRNEWDTDICKVAKMLTVIKEIKQKIHNLDDEQIRTPISVVFTKTDLLNAEEQKLPPYQLLEKYPQLRSSLVINNDKNSLKCFKVYVKSEKESIEKRREKIKLANERAQKSYNNKMKTIQKQVNVAIQNAVKIAEDQAIANGLGPEQVAEEIEKARTSVLEQNKNQLNQKSPVMNDMEEGVSWNVSVPLEYSKSEYGKLISWIVTKKHE